MNSFDALASQDVTAKKQDISIKIADGELKFTANEISFMQKLQLSNLQKAGGDYLTQLIVFSIKDEAGKHMTIEQAQKLSQEHVMTFFKAAGEVNKMDKDEPKN